MQTTARDGHAARINSWKSLPTHKPFSQSRHERTMELALDKYWPVLGPLGPTWLIPLSISDFRRPVKRISSICSVTLFTTHDLMAQNNFADSQFVSMFSEITNLQYKPCVICRVVRWSNSWKLQTYKTNIQRPQIASFANDHFTTPEGKREKR